MNDLRDEQLDGGVGPQKAGPAPIGRRGFPGVCCPACRGKSVCLDLAEVTTFRCWEDDCDWEATAEYLQEALANWAEVLRWVAMAQPLK